MSSNISKLQVKLAENIKYVRLVIFFLEQLYCFYLKNVFNFQQLKDFQ